MSILKINQIQERIGTVIPSISGTIVSVFPAKEGKSQHGAWKLQNIQIEDETGKAQVTLSGMEQSLNESHKGKHVAFESIGTKFGLKGVTVEEREWTDKAGNNKKTIGLKVTKTAKIILEGAGMVQEDAPDEIPMAFSEKGKPLMPYPEKTHTEPTRAPSKSPQDRIAQFGKLYKLCYEQAEEIDLFAINGELKKDVATTFFIQSVREGLADKMEVEGEEPF